MPFDAQDELKAVPGHRDYLSVIFRRCVLALVGARVPEETVFERQMLEQLVSLTENYLTNMISHLQRISHMQRRLSPSMADVGLFLHFNELNVLDLIEEAQRTPEIEESKSVVTLNELYFDPDEASLEPEQVAFFEQPKQLMKQSIARPAYMPSWMPSLPPEHTYMHTPSHSSQVRDLRTVRMSLVEEGHLAERALQRLLGDRGSSSVIELPKEGQPQKKRSMVVVDDQNLNEQQDPNDSIVSHGQGAANDISGTAEPRLLTPVSATTPTPQPELEGHAVADDETNLGLPTGNLDESDPNKVVSKESSSNGPHDEDTADASNKPLRIQLHLAKRENTPKKLSLKLSLGKNKKRKDSMLIGKRPRVDLVSLARNQQANEEERNMDVDENDPDESGAPTDGSTNNHNNSRQAAPKQDPHDLLAAALASYSR